MEFKAKAAHSFRAHFDNFGSGNANEHLMTHVKRITRPGAVFYDLLGLPEVESPAIEMDLCDDVTDRTRGEVVTQISKQIKDGAQFALVIETLDEAGVVIEQWRIGQCRIIEFRLDELARASDSTLTIHLVFTCGRVSTTAFGEMLDLLS